MADLVNAVNKQESERDIVEDATKELDEFGFDDYDKQDPHYKAGKAILNADVCFSIEFQALGNKQLSSPVLCSL